MQKKEARCRGPKFKGHAIAALSVAGVDLVFDMIVDEFMTARDSAFCKHHTHTSE